MVALKNSFCGFTADQKTANPSNPIHFMDFLMTVESHCITGLSSSGLNIKTFVKLKMWIKRLI